MNAPERSTSTVEVEVHLPAHWAAEQLRNDVRRAFTSAPIVLPPKWLYDERGSELFTTITGLPEYYQTEAEREVLRHHAAELAQRTAADVVVELGSGTSDKTRTLLDAFCHTGQLRRFVALDVSEATLIDAAHRLTGRYRGIHVHAVVGDFTQHLGKLPTEGRRLIAFLGGTVGNFYPAERQVFFQSVADVLRPGEWFLLGVDLVKPVDRLVAAYFDPGGVTKDFILNSLRVLNRELDADFDLDGFSYVPLWDPAEERMDLRLRSIRRQRARIAALDLDVELLDGEEIRVEISAKFRLAPLASELEVVGLPVRAGWTDGAGDFALCLCERTDG